MHANPSTKIVIVISTSICFLVTLHKSQLDNQLKYLIISRKHSRCRAHAMDNTVLSSSANMSSCPKKAQRRGICWRASFSPLFTFPLLRRVTWEFLPFGFTRGCAMMAPWSEEKESCKKLWKSSKRWALREASSSQLTGRFQAVARQQCGAQASPPRLVLTH